MKESKPWRPNFATNCCSADDHTAFGNFSRCRPNRSDLSKNIAPMPSSRRLSFSDLSRSSSIRLNEDLAASFGADLFDFQVSELRAITQNFSSNFLLGEGGFGRVHKGYVDENFRQGLRAQAVAVKLLDNQGLQGHREWLAEVVFLGQLRHPNLVKLIGYCCEDEERLLVYEFLPRGSLENHLFKRLSVSLPWSTRLKIAIGAAKGLDFLHGEEKPVIYRDFKTSNVLLDSDFTAKLSDFGLAKMGPEGSDTHVTTRVMGTYGYAAPEYISTGVGFGDSILGLEVKSLSKELHNLNCSQSPKADQTFSKAFQGLVGVGHEHSSRRHLTTKSDVYSFGVVLLEILTGRRAMDKSRAKNEQNLVDWAKPYLSSSRRLHCIMDPRLCGQYSVKGAKGMASLALQCTSLNPKDRPRMPAIVEALESLLLFKDMAVTSGHWSASAKHARNGVSVRAKTEAGRRNLGR